MTDEVDGANTDHEAAQVVPVDGKDGRARIIDFGGLSPAAMLSKEGLAEILGCTTKSVDRMVEAGELPGSFKWRGRCYWRVKELQAFFDRLVEKAAENAKRLSQRPM